MSLDQDGEGLGCERQLELGWKLAEARQFTVVVDPGATSDNSLSAAGGVHRPGFDRLLSVMDQGRVSAVVAYSFDRIARNQADGVRFLQIASARNVKVAFTQGGDLDLTTAMGQFVAEMMLAIAKLEIGIKGRTAAGGEPATRREGAAVVGWAAHIRLGGSDHAASAGGPGGGSRVRAGAGRGHAVQHRRGLERPRIAGHLP